MKINKKISLLMLCIIIFAITLLSVSCSKSNVKVDKLTVGQTGKGIKAAMVVLANEMGYFDEEQVEVEFVQIQDLNDGITAVTQNKLDVLPMGIIPSLTYIAQGSDLVVFGGTISEGSEVVCLPENSDNYKKLDDLAGKTIACVRPETGHLFAVDYLQNAGIDDVNWVELDGFQSGIEAVKKGNADLAFVNSGFGYNAEQQGLEKVFWVADFYPNNVCCRQTTSQKTFEEKTESLIRFEMANLRAYAFAYGNNDANKEEVIKKLANYSGLENDYVEYSIYSGVMKYELDPATDRVRDFYQVMENIGEINPSNDINIDNHMDISIYQEALERLCKQYPEEQVYSDLFSTISEHNSVLTES